MLAACASAWSATVYKWVDDNGVVHFSDQPNPKAQKLEVAGAQTYSAPTKSAPPAAAAPVAPLPSTAAPVCVIDTPAPGQVFLDTFSITGHVTLAHAGPEGSETQLRMDGNDITALLSPNGGFALTQIARGEHTLTLQVTTDHGDVTCQGNSVTFSIRQRTVTGAAGVPAAPMAPGAPRAPGVGVPH
ncbi:MAG TPA: DUF4124 domain-containing protein [Steroidobacteraceae bacterium]|nr:DUF4124 domain-containing protein [Steroidobacteraceae bacterium]